METSRNAIRDWFSVTEDKRGPLPSKAISPYRDSSVEDNLLKFEKMRVGYYPEGAVCLRMKCDLTR